ncbi:MAG: signal recognition particle protein [Caldiserica bacterium]|nr:MAG: signal recognition particle protein [Caldisericota bacterium]
MFDKISSGIKEFLDRFGRKGLLTKKDIEDGLEFFKKILISSDVNIKVAKEILRRVKKEAEKEESLKSLVPQEQMTKILYEELIRILGKTYPLKISSIPPTEIILFGIQGSGKTTTSGKLALYLQRRGYRVLLVPLDLKRPGAIEQLKEISEKVESKFFFEENKNVYSLIKKAKNFSKKNGIDFIIYDTPGRLHIDKEMMQELKDIRDEIKPKETLLVASALLGQGSVDIAIEFKRKVGLTGIIATKVDGDSKGGSILSMKFVTGVPIKFIGTGEKMEDFSEFDPESFAGRIMGFGDIKGLIKKIERVKEEREKITIKKMEKFDLNLFLSQMETIEKMGGFSSLLSHIPGVPAGFNVDEKEIKRMKAIVQSMTKRERKHPEIIDGSRKRRIAMGSGTSVNEINKLLKNFKMMKQMMGNKNLDKIIRRGGLL